MSKIVKFSKKDFFEIQDQYNEMNDQIATRAAEIAKDFGKIDYTWYAKNIEIPNSSIQTNVKVLFVRAGDENTMTNMEFDIDWLFSDDYKSMLMQEPLKSQIEHDKEYTEYIRLQAKFQKEAIDNLKI
jgi:predicted component of type VI protein secretion system